MAHSYPLIKDFKNCSRDDFVEAAKELFVLIVFAGMPVWLGLIFSVLSKADKATTIFFLEFLASGESLLISAALVGPLIYVITRKYGDLPEAFTIRFPQGWLFVVLIAIICVIAAATFGFDRVFRQAATDHGRSSVFDESSIRMFSLCTLFISVAIVYLVSVLRNYLDRGAPAIMRSDTQSFLDQWGKK
jgi:uncharacterized membrane protein